MQPVENIPALGLRTRWAPTPSGFLHAGNACNAILTFALARAFRGSVRLRVDDLDAPRTRPEYIEDIFQTLEWLDLEPDSGPSGPSECTTWSQHQRIARYGLLLENLFETGRIYACTCSRAEILAASIDRRYPGTCREKALDPETPNASWRLDTRGLTAAIWQDVGAGPQFRHPVDFGGDIVVKRRDGLPAYHIASLADDLDCRINLIVRGMDLLDSTAIQLALANLAGRPEFARSAFYHHPLIKNEKGEKLSKSAGANSIAIWRAAGKKPDTLFQTCAQWLGIAPNLIVDIRNAKDLQPFMNWNLLRYPDALRDVAYFDPE